MAKTETIPQPLNSKFKFQSENSFFPSLVSEGEAWLFIAASKTSDSVVIEILRKSDGVVINTEIHRSSDIIFEKNNGGTAIAYITGQTSASCYGLAIKIG